MPSVTFYETTRTGQKPIGTAVLKGTKVVVQVPEHLRTTVARIYIGGRFYTPEDGVAYLKALPTAFSGSFFRAGFDD